MGEEKFFFFSVVIGCFLGIVGGFYIYLFIDKIYWIKWIIKVKKDMNLGRKGVEGKEVMGEGIIEKGLFYYMYV